MADLNLSKFDHVSADSGDTTTEPSKPDMGATECIHCGSAMCKSKKAEKNYAVQLLGVAVFFFGLWLMFALGVIGVVIGLVLMIVSTGLGYKKVKIWRCKNCGYHFERL